MRNRRTFPLANATKAPKYNQDISAMLDSNASNAYNRNSKSTLCSSVLTNQSFAWGLSHQVLLSLSVLTCYDAAMNLLTELPPSLQG